MGNCCKKPHIFDEYLFKPLNSENNIDSELDNISNELSYKDQSCCNRDQIDNLFKITNEINGKLSLLEQNTTRNLQLLSEDIHYINKSKTIE
jgi:hypothetical protein